MTKRLSMLGLMLTAALVGCQTETPDPMARLLIQPDDAAVMGFRIRWHSDLDIPYGSRLHDAWILDDILVAYEPNNIVSVLDIESGKLLWRAGVGSLQERLSAPDRFGGTLVLSSETRSHLYSIKTGELLRVATLAHLVNTPPVVDDGHAIFGTPIGRIYAVDLATDYVLWEYQMGAAITTRPLLWGGMVVTTDRTGGFAALHPETGKLIWRERTYGRISADPIADNHRIFVASEDYTLYAFDRATGDEQWKRPTGLPLAASPVLIDGKIFQEVPAKSVHVYDATSGNPLWELPLTSVPITTNDRMLIVHRPGWLDAIDLRSGAKIEEARLKMAHRVLSDRPHSGNIFLIRDDGRITKLGPQ